MHIRQYATMYPPICDLLAGFIQVSSYPNQHEIDEEEAK